MNVVCSSESSSGEVSIISTHAQIIKTSPVRTSLDLYPSGGHVALRSYHAVSNLIWKVWRSLLLIQREICLLDEDQRILTPGWRKFRKSITERGSSLSRKQRDTLSGLRKRTACEIINKNRKCNRRVPKA